MAANETLTEPSHAANFDRAARFKAAGADCTGNTNPLAGSDIEIIEDIPLNLNDTVKINISNAEVNITADDKFLSNRKGLSVKDNPPSTGR